MDNKVTDMYPTFIMTAGTLHLGKLKINTLSVKSLIVSFTIILRVKH